MSGIIYTMDAKNVHTSPEQGSRTSSHRRMRQIRAVNGLGMAGYFFVAIQWLFAFALYFNWLQRYILEPMQPTAPAPRPDATPAPSVDMPMVDPFSFPFILLFGLLTLGMIALTVYAFVKMPRMVAKAGSETARVVAAQSAPLALKARKLPETKANTLKAGARIIVAVKLLLVSVPIGLGALSAALQDQVVPYPLALWVALALSLPSVLFFIVQYTSAQLAKVRMSDLV